MLLGVAPQKVGPDIEYKEFKDSNARNVADYAVKGNKLITVIGENRFEVTVYNMNGRYLAAHSADKGVVNWELVESN